MMIEELSDMPPGVTGVRVSGRLTRDDLRGFAPTMRALTDAEAREIRIVEVIASDYEGFGPGALFEDLKLGLGAVFRRYSAFKRIAVVSDKAWVGHVLHAVGWLVPGELAIFGLAELDRAAKWAAG